MNEVNVSTLAWCPNCGDALTKHFFPHCMNGGAVTPLYVEVNGVVQYVPGVPTYVEFYLFNAATEGSLTIEAFSVRIGENELQPGIHTETPSQEIKDGEDEGIVVDRLIDLDIDKVVFAEYMMDVSVDFSCADGRFQMKGQHRIRFDTPDSRSIHWHDAAEDALIAVERNDVPDCYRTLQGTSFGEHERPSDASLYIRKLKSSLGLRFIPVRMAYLESESKKISQFTDESCAKCGTTLTQGGPFCHGCGAKIESPKRELKLSKPDTIAYCSNCRRPRGALNALHRHCPMCGVPTLFSVQVQDFSCYLQKVQAGAVFRLHWTHGKPVRFSKVQVVLGSGPNAVCGIRNYYGPFHLNSKDSTIEFEATVYPDEDVRLGKAWLEFRIECECENMRYRYEGSHEIFIEDRKTDKQTIINKFGPDTVGVSDNAIVSLGVISANINVASPEGGDQVAEYINELKKNAEFTPVRLQISKRSESAPDWERMDSARLWFTNGDVQHNYCLLTKSGLIFGRSEESDVRFYDIEQYLAAKEGKNTAGSATEQGFSSISRRQWRITPVRDGVQVEGLSNNASYLAGDRLFSKNSDPVRLRRDEFVRVSNGVGLTLSAISDPADKFREKLEDARKIVSQTNEVSPAENRVPASFGAYRLDRMNSLCGKPIDGFIDQKMLEAYVLLGNWASIGSGEDACIRVTGTGVEPVHAYILFADGYFFLLRDSANAMIAVDSKELEYGKLFPLRPGTRILLGDTPVVFAEFEQHFFPRA